MKAVRFFTKAGAILFWLLLWQGGAMLLNRSLLLPIPTPLTTLRALSGMMRERAFYLTVGASLWRICGGFLLALIGGTVCAFAAARMPIFRALTEPLLQLIRAVPVASFTILVFLWVSREQIPGCISFMTVFPIVWANVESGLAAADRDLTEMARVFGMKSGRILREITLPGIRPYFSAAAATGLGFAWKSGVAAEVICRTGNSIGDLLWSSKTAVDYDEVFALTLVIVLLSVALQAAAQAMLRGGKHHGTVG